MKRIGLGSGEALYDRSSTRLMEAIAKAELQQRTLMQRAGLAVAQMAMAIAPHARHIWIACGSGDNGGDGLEAAVHLHRWGKIPVLTWLGKPSLASKDTLAAYERGRALQLSIGDAPPENFDLCIDALLGIGFALREPTGQMADWINRMNRSGVPILSVDVPSGLDPDTGSVVGLHIHASHTLSLLTLKPGFFTAHGRDACGDIWLDTLGVTGSDSDAHTPVAYLNAATVHPTRPHTSHKGSFGDVAVIGGASGMTGAALLAASAALYAGAGRVFVSLLDEAGTSFNPRQPDLMFRNIGNLNLDTVTIVCGCGAGASISAHMPRILSAESPVVIDADALNSIASSSELQNALEARSRQALATVLSPHPLEAARLLGWSTTEVQQDRLAAANQLSIKFACIVVLKGSGTVIAAPGKIPVLNATGNARLAIAGTGDVLAGMIGARLAGGLPAFEAACAAVYEHGAIANAWQGPQRLTASHLAHSSAKSSI